MVAHGGEVDRAAIAWGCAREDVLDLSTGVRPEPDPEGLAGRLRRLAPFVSQYPDPDGEPARSRLAAELGVPAENLLVGAGAQAFVEVVFSAMGWSSVALQDPEYGEVRRCATRSGVRVCATDLGARWPDAEVAWVTTPHGFTGETRARPGARAGVLDESYASLAVRRRTGLVPGWIRIGSLTKTFSMPGLRLGYAIADSASLASLRARLPPWPAGTLALHLLAEVLPSWSERDQSAAAAVGRLGQLLGEYGWEPRPSDASFVVARPRGPLPDFARDRILVRTFAGTPSLDRHVRFGLPGNPPAWERLRASLAGAPPQESGWAR